MKSNIHPQWNHKAVVKCACGNSFETGLTTDLLEIDICSACHPFFTGEMKFVDIQGRVDRFKSRQQFAAQVKQSKKSKKADDTEETVEEVKSLKDMLQQEKKRLAATEKTEDKKAA